MTDNISGSGLTKLGNTILALTKTRANRDLSNLTEEGYKKLGTVISDGAGDIQTILGAPEFLTDIPILNEKAPSVSLTTASRDEIWEQYKDNENVYSFEVEKNGILFDSITGHTREFVDGEYQEYVYLLYEESSGKTYPECENLYLPVYKGQKFKIIAFNGGNSQVAETAKLYIIPVTYSGLVAGGESNITLAGSLVAEVGTPIPTMSNTLNDDEIWLEGAEVDKVTYSELYEIYGDTYGTASDETKFVLPDLRGRTLWGSSKFGYNEGAIPNIAGAFTITGGNIYWTTHTGPFYENKALSGNWYEYRDSAAYQNNTMGFNAARCSALYKDNVSYIQPTSVNVRWKTKFMNGLGSSNVTKLGEPKHLIDVPVVTQLTNNITEYKTDYAVWKELEANGNYVDITIPENGVLYDNISTLFKYTAGEGDDASEVQYEDARSFVKADDNSVSYESYNIYLKDLITGYMYPDHNGIYVQVYKGQKFRVMAYCNSSAYTTESDVRPTSHLYLLPCAVSTGGSNVTNANPYTLLQSFYSDKKLNNVCCLRSSGQWNPKATYTSVYEALEVEYDSDITADTVVTLASGGKYTKVGVDGGVSVKLSTEEYTDYDFVLNNTDETFRLPLKSVLAGSSDNNVYLYYYVGNAVTDEYLVNLGSITERVVDLSNSNRGYLVESYQNGGSWYRVYSDGWCEQGGKITGSGTQTVTFFKQYINNFYTCTTTGYGNQQNVDIYFSAKTNGTMTLSSVPTGGTDWVTHGYIQL